MDKALEVYKLIHSMGKEEAKQVTKEIGRYLDLSVYETLDCDKINRIKVIKMITRSDPTMSIKSAKMALDLFIAEVQAEAKEGYTHSQRMSRRSDAMEIYKCMLNADLSYELAINATKNALRAFNEEF